jgi:hypothetical protein
MAKTKSVQTTPSTCGSGKSADDLIIICDFADANAFVENWRRPHAPVIFCQPRKARNPPLPHWFCGITRNESL